MSGISEPAICASLESVGIYVTWIAEGEARKFSSSRPGGSKVTSVTCCFLTCITRWWQLKYFLGSPLFAENSHFD